MRARNGRFLTVLPVAVLISGMAMNGNLQQASADHVARPSQPTHLTASEAHQRATSGTLVLIDIRSQDEWRETGLAASAHAITMHQSKQSFMRALSRATGNDKSRPIALICATGVRSHHLQEMLEKSGYSAVYDVSEGMLGNSVRDGFIAAKLPLRRWSRGEVLPASAK